MLERLETRSLMSAAPWSAEGEAGNPEVANVDVPAAAGTSIAVDFTENVNAAALIADGSIKQAVTLIDYRTGAVTLPAAAAFSYNASAHTLTVPLSTALAPGKYELRLDGSKFKDTDNELLLGGRDGLPADLPLWGNPELVRANGTNIQVNKYSVPSLADWDGDGLYDLIVGEQISSGDGKIRVYLNQGDYEAPAFGAFAYAKLATGADISVSGATSLGVHPRVVDWDYDGLPDLVLGLADGTIKVALNTNPDGEPRFASPVAVEVGQPGAKTPIDIGDYAAFDIADWNNDGACDLIVGAADGKVRVYLDTAVSGPPDFRSVIVVQDGSADLFVPGGQASVAVADMNYDGNKDLVLGNTNGQLVFYANQGSDDAPQFAGYELLWANDTPIDLADTPRSRPFVGDYNEDWIPDLLVGSGDGYVRLYVGADDPGLGVDDPGALYRYVFQVAGDAGANPWQNTLDKLDVNSDGKVSPLDALVIIIYLNDHGPRDLPVPPGSPFIPPPYYDTSGNRKLAPLDALLVIQVLNDRGPYVVSCGCGEGEGRLPSSPRPITVGAGVAEGETPSAVLTPPAGPQQDRAEAVPIRTVREWPELEEALADLVSSF